MKIVLDCRPNCEAFEQKKLFKIHLIKKNIVCGAKLNNDFLLFLPDKFCQVNFTNERNIKLSVPSIFIIKHTNQPEETSLLFHGMTPGKKILLIIKLTLYQGYFILPTAKTIYLLYMPCLKGWVSDNLAHNNKTK